MTRNRFGGIPPLKTNPERFAATMEWLMGRRPNRSDGMAVWVELFAAVEPETGRITASVEGIAARMGRPPRVVFGIMEEMCAVRVLLPELGADRAGYTLNPWLATYLDSPQREAAQAVAPDLRL